MNNGNNQPNHPYHIPPEYQVYVHPDFDPQAFANSVLNNEPYHSTDISQISSGDVSSVLSKLNLGIEDITKQLKSQVTTHHLKLLTKAGSVASLDGSLHAIRNSLQQIEINVERLQTKIGYRYSTLETALNRLGRYQSAAELVRRANRFVTLAKRLEAQMSESELALSNKLDHHHHHHHSVPSSQLETIQPVREQQDITLAESALTISELEKLLNSEIDSSSVETMNNSGPDSSPNPTYALSSIRSLTAIQPHVQMIVKARQKVEGHMSKSLNEALLHLDRSMLSSAFQTAYNLSILDQTIGSIVFDLTALIAKRIKLVFDINSVAREAGVTESTTTSSFGYKARARTEPTSATIPQWTSALWSRLEGLIDDLCTCCVKVYTLEKVLEWKKDPITGISFLSVVIGSGSMLEERPSTVFWTTLSASLSKETRETLKSSNFISHTLSTNYPHLLRLFQDLFSRISLHTNTVYNSSTQSPETILTLRAILPLENIYLNRSVSKMTEASNGRVDKLTAVLINELDAARFDPLLVRSVAKKVKEVLDNYSKRMESRIATDYLSTSLVGPVATSSQISNIEIFNNLSQLFKTLSKSILDYPEEIQNMLDSSIQLVERIRQGILDPILTSIKRELSIIIAKMHHPRNNSNVTSVNPTGGTMYMQELKSKLNLIETEILGRLDKTHVESSANKLGRELLRIFLIHASLISPLSESMKLRLAADLAELEFEVTQFLISNHHQPSPVKATMTSFGNDYLNQEEIEDHNQVEFTNQLNNLKVFRQLIFCDNPTEVEDLINQSTLEQLIIVHHFIVKHQTDQVVMNNNQSSATSVQLKLIHQMNSWSEAEYVRWVEEYSSMNNHSFESFEPLKIFKNYLNDQSTHFGQQVDLNSLDFQTKNKWFLMALKFVNSD